MKYTLVTIFFAGCVATITSAFTCSSPGLAVRKTTSVKAIDLDQEFGVSIETGNRAPPLAKSIVEYSDKEVLKWFQNAELKHGRIAMVATIGWLVQTSGLHFPIYLGPSGAEPWLLSKTTGVSFADISAASPFDAINMVPMAGWLQIFFAAGIFEAAAYERQWNQGRDIPGDYGFDPIGFTKREGGWDSEELKALRLKEIKNGRLAMIAIAGWVSNEAIPGALPWAG